MCAIMVNQLKVDFWTVNMQFNYILFELNLVTVVYKTNTTQV